MFSKIFLSVLLLTVLIHICLNQRSSCDNLNFQGTTYGFTEDFIAKMQDQFEAGINVDGTGAVAATQDKDFSYYGYHWPRDAGLSLGNYLEINTGNYNKVHVVMDSYVKWVTRLQTLSDPDEGLNVLEEPRFYIETGAVDQVAWCRPQTDGPAIRSFALEKWAQILISKGKIDEAKSVFKLIDTDLQFLINNYDKQSCDLWEEDPKLTNIFWSRMAAVASFETAKELVFFLDLDNKEQLADLYSKTAKKMGDQMKDNFNGEIILQSDNYDIDGSVIHAILTFSMNDNEITGTYKGLMPEVAKTVKKQCQTWCNEFQINQTDNDKQIPGILIGRYVGDVYIGGNPWPLLTAAQADLFYQNAYLLRYGLKKNYCDQISDNCLEWANFFGIQESIDGKIDAELANAFFKAGDAVMERIWEHVKTYDGRIDEQIDKFSGEQVSAKGLIWSYGNVLHALWNRKRASDKANSFNELKDEL